jgi:hypothetical protein
MSVTLQHKEWLIEVFDDSSFTESPDSPTRYDKVYQHENHKEYSPISQHAIVVYHDNKKIASAILLASAGGTVVSEDAMLIEGDDLIARCCNMVFSLTIPQLDLNWMLQADSATVFSIHRYQDSFITHGEMGIARIDWNGKECWRYGGSDIFVCIEKGNPFQMHENHIELMDFNGSKYKIDYDGNTIEYIESDYHKQEPVTVWLKPQKPWWKFW